MSSNYQCNRSVTIKNFSGYKGEFVIYSTHSLSDLISLIENDMKIGSDKTIGLIYEGKSVNSTNFNNITHGATLLAITRNKSDNVSSNSSNVNSSVQLNESNKSNKSNESNLSNLSNESNDIDAKYSYKQCRALLIVFLDFIRSNPQMRTLYQNNYPQLVKEVLANPLLDNIIKNMLSQTGQIIKAMETGSEIKININGDSGEVDEIVLTKEDEEKIQMLIEMGFTTNALKTYLECNKDFDETMKKLLE
jgi:hypothetical protein